MSGPQPIWGCAGCATTAGLYGCPTHGRTSYAIGGNVDAGLTYKPTVGDLIIRAEERDRWVDLASPEAAEALARVFRDKGWMLVDAAKMRDRYGLPEPDGGWADACAAAILAAMRETGR